MEYLVGMWICPHKMLFFIYPEPIALWGRPLAPGLSGASRAGDSRGCPQGSNRRCAEPREGGPLTASDRQGREIEALRERVSRLTAAILRISASLDVSTVLREVVDSARALTGARYGVITTIDEAGQPQDYVISGLAPDEQRQLLEWPHGLRLFEHLRNLPGPLRLRDLPGYVRSLGYSPDLVVSKTLQATPMRHRTRHVGAFFLGEKQGGQEFTADDEEILVLFASQAAAAIANARTHRDEQRARAGLKALVETTPVGVVVFDAQTGNPVSFNGEARRLAEQLSKPGHPPEQLLEILTCRFSDGREVALPDFPMQRVIGGAATVRAEEVVLSVPDGRSVTMLVNASPIHAADGVVESMVVTLQDLAPLQELERLRAEFLGMVSHELRAPLTSIKGSAATVLGASGVLEPAEVRQFFRIIETQADQMSELINDLLDAGRIDAGTLPIDPEPVEVAALVEQARTTFLSGAGRQTIRIDLPPDLPRVMADERRIVQVLGNLLSNASRHAPESSVIHVGAVRDGVHVAISVTDEGRGVPPEQLPHLFRKYADVGGKGRPHGIAGAGLGLVICKGLVEAHGGRIRAESAGSGRGTRFTFTVPAAEEAAAGSSSSRPHPSRDERERSRILVVDDDPETLRWARNALAGAGFAVLVTGDPKEAQRLVRSESPQLVLLDLMLPGTDGIEWMKSVPEMADLPVIFISGYGQGETIARALDAGAADYVVKPFSAAELTARVRTALRHGTGAEAFVLRELTIDYGQRRVTVAGRPVHLTVTEYELLRVLSTSTGQVSTYDSLLRQVWRGRANDPKLVRTVVKDLRRKLGDDASRPIYVVTERGIGYRMAKPDDT